MILMNATESSIFNFENVTHIHFDTKSVFLISKRKITCPGEIFNNILADLHPMLRQLSHIFVFPSGFAINMDHVEQIEYINMNDKSSVERTARVRFTNGNILLLNSIDIDAFHALLKAKAPPQQAETKLWTPGENGH